MSNVKDKINAPATTGFGLGFSFQDNTYKVRGDVMGRMTFPDGTEQVVLDKKNIYTLDGGVLAAMLFSGQAGANPVNMLAVGTGYSGDQNSPDLADNRQRSLRVELTRKTFSSVVYRNADGTESSVPTNVVDLTTVFNETEAVGGLVEMGLVSARDTTEDPSTSLNTDVFPARNTALNLTTFDVLVNYLTFPVINKPSGAVLALTWRLTF